MGYSSSSHPVYYPYAGLFGYLSGNGSVENLKLNGVNISGYMNVGAIAGYAGSDAAVEDCTVENVTITVVRTIDGSDLTHIRAGAVVGYSSRELTNCSSKNAKVNLEMSDGILKNIEYKTVYSGDYITSFDVETMADFIATTEMINAKSSLLAGESVTMNLAAGEYDFAEVEYKPASIKGFTVEGNNAVIKNLNAADENGWAGLFSSIENSTVKNLTFDGATLEGCAVGVVAGKAISSTLEGITVKGNVNLSWVAKPEMDYSQSGIGLLTGYWDNNSSNAPKVSLECTANIDFGKIAYKLYNSSDGPRGLMLVDEDTHYFGCCEHDLMSGRPLSKPETTGIVRENGYQLTTRNFVSQGKSLSVGDKITFGSYPQSKVEDDETITALNAKKTDAWKDSNNKQYQDITLENGKKYRGVKNDDGSVEWFSFDPITWRVVENGGYGNKASYAKYTLLADCILDNQMQYSNDAVYSNPDWIYGWLEDTFAKVAFGEADSVQYKLLQNDNAHGQAVSLLPRSIAESFQDDWHNQSEKWLKGSDYAYCQGLDKDNPWWLSSNRLGDTSDVYMIGSSVVSYMDVREAKYGVAPIICLGSEIGFLTFD